MLLKQHVPGPEDGSGSLLFVYFPPTSKEAWSSQLSNSFIHSSSIDSSPWLRQKQHNGLCPHGAYNLLDGDDGDVDDSMGMETLIN